MTPDIINGLFEFLGALLIANNFHVLYHDKEVKGFHWTTTAFFTSWGLWNLFYYPNLDQWFSFAGGVAIVATNAAWLGLTLYYMKRPGGRAAAWKSKPPFYSRSEAEGRAADRELVIYGVKGCDDCKVDGQHGSCALGLKGCKWT